MTAGPLLPKGPPQAGTPGPLAAEHLVQHVRQRWDHRNQDLDSLLDAACIALSESANHELRQVLAQLSTELELLRLTLDVPPQAEERFDRMFTALDRASSVVSTHLDRNEACKMLIHVAQEPIDLAEILAVSLERVGLPQDGIDASLQPAPIRGDDAKLAAGLEHLIQRAARSARSRSELTAHVTVEGDTVRGLIGSDPAPMDAEALIAELEQPLDIGELGVDLPYTRAVIERHGGTLFVDRFGEEGLGFGFQLPANTTDGGGP